MTLQDLIKYFRKITVDPGNAGTRTETAYRLYNNAILLVKVGRLDEARRDLRDAVKLVPGFDDAYMLLGLTYFELGNRIESIKTINQITDGAKHNQAMKFYDMLSRDTDENVEGSFIRNQGDESEEERRARQSERMNRAQYAGDGNEDDSDGNSGAGAVGGIGNVVFELDEGIDFNSSENAGREADANLHKGDFRKRFAQAQKNAEQNRVAMENGITRRSANEIPISERVAASVTRNQNRPPLRTTSVTQEESNAEINNAPETAPEPPEENLPADKMREEKTERIEERPEAETKVETEAENGVSVEETADTAEEGDEKPETSPEAPAASGKKSNGNRAVLLALVIVICLGLVAAVAVLAVKLHRKAADGNKPGTSTTAPSIPTAVPGSDPTPGSAENTRVPESTGTAQPETPTPENGEDPTATAGEQTPEVTATPTATPTSVPTEAPTATPTAAPTTAPKTDAELAFEQKQKLAQVKELYAKKQYYECYKQIAESDWSHLDRTQTTEKNELAAQALEAFSNNYFNQMYGAFGKEEWQTALNYAEAIIQFNPDYRRGDEVFFHAGRSAHELGDKAKAEKYYNETIARYPDSRFSGYAKYKLQELNKN
ncbi:MAG: tetratricopeptide repeat protein [Clostridia bacterium]|nr:tetratricopeptide repeat protein [Clostridia bacterium]